jgi:hypothetical protein
MNIAKNEGVFFRHIIPILHSLSRKTSPFHPSPRCFSGEIGFSPWPWVVALWGVKKAAAARSGSGLRANLAFFPTPLGESGSFTNLREENLTVGDLFRGAFVHMAENYHASALRRSPERAWRRLVFSGGLAQKLELLRGLIVEKFQMDYRLGSSAEDTLNGVLALALVASGRVHSLQKATELLRQAPSLG